MAGKDKKEEKIAATNIFVQLLDQNYANKLEKVISYDSIEDRYTNMEKLFNQSISLPDKKKTLMNNLYMAFRDAGCMDGPSKRLMDLLDKKPNLLKMLTKYRTNRIYDDIDSIVYRMGFGRFVTSRYIPLFFSNMISTYGKTELETKPKFDVSDNVYVLNILAALLAKYARVLNPYDYHDSFFVLCFCKNLSYNCIIGDKSILDNNPELVTYASHLFELANKIYDLYIKDTDKKEIDIK